MCGSVPRTKTTAEGECISNVLGYLVLEVALQRRHLLVEALPVPMLPGTLPQRQEHARTAEPASLGRARVVDEVPRGMPEVVGGGSPLLETAVATAAHDSARP